MTGRFLFLQGGLQEGRVALIAKNGSTMLAPRLKGHPGKLVEFSEHLWQLGNTQKGLGGSSILCLQGSSKWQKLLAGL